MNDAGDAALHHAESLYGAHPTAADAAMLLATLYASHNRLEDSERVLKQALVAQPRDVEVLNALASAYLRSGKLHLAEQTFRQIVNSDPATLEYRLRLAGFYDQQKDYDKAETVLREAIQAEPQHIQRHLTLADFLATRRGPAQGERVLLDAVETHPRATELHFALGRLYERSGQNEKARSLYQQLVEEFVSKPAGRKRRSGLPIWIGRAGKRTRQRSILSPSYTIIPGPPTRWYSKERSRSFTDAVRRPSRHSEPC